MPQRSKGVRTQINLRLLPTVLDHIDAQRGITARNDWIVAAILMRLNGRPAPPPITDGRS
jgi:hypothetical protein